jgi:hypothetical protein
MSNYTRVGLTLIGDGANVALPANTTLSTISAGDLFVTDENNNILANATASAAISRNAGVKIIQGTGPGKFISTDLIRGMYTSNYLGKVYSAPTEQITYVGYDSVANTGNLAVLDNTSYDLNVTLLDDRRIHGEQQTRSIYTYKTPLTGASLSDLAFGILRNSEQRLLPLPGGTNYVKVEVVSNGTYTVNAAGTLTVVTGSNVVTSSAASGYVAGDVIRIGAGGSTFPIYTIQSVVGNTITLTNLYAGPSATAVVYGKMTVITAYGFKLTGLAVAPNIPTDTYTKVQFTASFGIATVDSNYVVVTTQQKVFYGQGYWEQVKDAQFFGQAYLGVTNRTLFPVVQQPTYYVVGATYDTVVIEYSSDTRADFQDTQNDPKKAIIYIAQVTVPAASGEQAGYTTATDFVAILNGYFSTTVGFPAINTF